MHTKKFGITLKSVKRFLELGANLNIIRILEQSHPADIAHLFRHLSTEEKKKLFRIVRSSESLAAQVLSEMGEDHWSELVADLDAQEASGIVQEMESDDAADLLAMFEEKKVREIIQLMQDEEAASEVKMLLDYDEDTAGGIMNPDVFAVDERVTVSEAVDQIRKAEEMEMVFYVYVVDSHRHLLGVVSLRQLIVSPPQQTMREIMNPDVIYVTEDMDQEEVAREVERYGLVA
ncbi:MAG: CBS domain-containing protein, partial [bacterium]|nr:CBS domain-containing protein [bacterium]